ncbi:hypothetical protein H112_05769 [Trichophyton rubrum D6]|nr:uncharacterized protein TERG_03482 [Trichophyton rubrum CBS 118892]EZF16326.1 hypothetical protein H100_05786 [Trichophyton rubrum MR850]EZF40462.1 hypothetical protein H102_05754 [Trichophyton rubrum CBS 100081]EZF50969.1 hypothetical protein H103_05781 [Trichophyton rubrum CBS 288.86]EZF61684.1 hypothetical protein H104_05765 [Trichophyton rubrum CBS 289.86]EZF72074.1 hypothetical protein H105_05795 [Trichophyton soudanense CBS 452.61]EZF82795.1 hypothetical protein H110_05774 [Trichophy
MLPPSSPQHYPSRGSAAQPSQPPSIPPSFASRELINPVHRPGSSMSISSMLGSDTDRQPRESTTSAIYSRPMVSAITAPAQQPTSLPPSMSPPSGPSRQLSSDHPPFRRSHTPDSGPFSKTLTPRPYRSRSGGSSSGNPQLGHDDSRFSGPRQTSNAPQSQLTAPRSPRNTYSDSSYHQDRRMSLGGPVPRTNPPGPHHRSEEPPSRPPLFSPPVRLAPGFSDGVQKETSGQREQYGYPGSLEPPPRPSSRFSNPSQDRQEPRDQQPYQHGIQEHTHHHHHHHHHNQNSQSQSQPHQNQSQRYGSHAPEHESDRSHRSSWELNYPRVSPESTRYSTAEPSSGYGFGSIQNYTKSLGSQLTAPRSIPGQPQISSRQDATPSSDSSPVMSRSRPPPSNPPRIFSPTPGSTGPQSSFGGSFADEERARGGTEEPPHHKNVLNINAEAKRGGRASPLPQAVQGAQAQIIDPATESGIKSELGRVFSGIGSGVGVSSSASLGGSGPSTPLSSSPFKRNHGDRPMNSDLNGEGSFGAGKGTESAPGSVRRGRKVKEEEAREDGEGIGAAARGGVARRGRHVHHHHHHHGGHHHHHRHRADDDPSLFTGGQGPQLAPPFRPQSRTGDGPAASGAVGASHHHHHHHHHHHGPRAAAPGSGIPHHHHPPAPAAPLKEYNTTVNLEPLLKSIAHLPRYHLGSTLYAPRIEMPSSRAPPEASKFGYTSTPVPIPRFDGKENCTFTIRVPRFRIDASHREEICARRALWGTGVYTDDSDPVAAAIHSGFIRGEWAEDVDVSMLNLELKDNRKSSTTTVTANGNVTAANGKTTPSSNRTPSVHSNSTRSDPTSTAQSEGPQPPPTAAEPVEGKQLPPIPPPDKDLHIKLLILPTLERYESSVMYGLKSRSWGKNHDGMSFKVEEISWVDEGASKGEERGGEARRKRLRNMMRTGRICTPAGLKGRKGVELHLSSNRDPDTTMKDADEPPAVQASTSTAVEPVS